MLLQLSVCLLILSSALSWNGVFQNKCTGLHRLTWQDRSSRHSFQFGTFRLHGTRKSKKGQEKDGTIETSRPTKESKSRSSKANSNSAASTLDSLSTKDVSETTASSNPVKPLQIPPEIAYFGEPRNPPPASLASDTKYHGSLLYWARHATVAPRTSQDRLASVFPTGRLHASSASFRLLNTDNHAHPAEEANSLKRQSDVVNKKLKSRLVSFEDNISTSQGISYEAILSAFVAVMDDLEASKNFLNTNMDIVPSALFLRALTADKLAAQSRRNIERMKFLKDVRKKYILAHDQLFFPLNIEVQKAETRVMTYLARPELANFASEWDSVEMTLHFATLLAARHTWDNRVREVLGDIKKKVDSSVGYMSQGLKKDLMDREFRKPAITAEMYLNASLTIQRDMRHLYEKVRPEVQLLHEVYFINKEADVLRYIKEDFLPRFQMTEMQLKERLRLLEATVAAIQGVDYVSLRLSIQSLYYQLCSEAEAEATDLWYTEFMERDTSDFVTYEPDVVPTLLQAEQRLRDTGNAFANFAVEVLNLPTQYSNAFSGRRPKASQVGDWLALDPEFESPQPETFEERIEQFRAAYMVQTDLRKAAEAQLDREIVSTMDRQDAIIGSSGERRSPLSVDESGDWEDPGSVFMYNGGDE